MINVVNKRIFKGKNLSYIGRGSPLGNPFTHKEGTKAEFIVDSIETAVEAYRSYLNDAINNKDKKICDELNRLYKLYYTQGEVLNLGCYCKYKGDELCHGDIVKEVLEKAINKSTSGRIIHV